jgi:thiol-disulfide isomerase/thioredoxin
MRIGTELPSLEGATEWLNAAEPAAESAQAATLVHFWAVSCPTCKENLPRLAELRARYADRLRLVAVHMPRYPADTDVDAVRAAVAEFQIVEPCAIDNRHALRDAFQNTQGWVPAYYLFDGENKLKSFAAGERGLGIVTAALERVLDRPRS